MKHARKLIPGLALTAVAGAFLYSSLSCKASPWGDDTTPITVEGLKDFNITRHASHRNLDIYLIAGKTTADNKEYVTLDLALEKKWVVVKETGSVNELALDNKSDKYVYINSGDIVKGGRQDRTIQYDVIIPPKKNNIPLASFCVEHSRWSQRGNESAAGFSSSKNSLSSKELRYAAKFEKSQTKVWSEVSNYQRKANTKLKSMAVDTSAIIDVTANASSSSLELTLDNEELKKKKEDFRKAILIQLGEHTDAAGIAYFINGKLYSIDIFNNRKLFNDLFDKLIDAAVTEAIAAEEQKGTATASAGTISKALEEASTRTEEKDVNEATHFAAFEYAQQKDLVYATTTDRQLKQWLHSNWLTKPENILPEETPQQIDLNVPRQNRRR